MFNGVHRDLFDRTSMARRRRRRSLLQIYHAPAAVDDVNAAAAAAAAVWPLALCASSDDVCRISAHTVRKSNTRRRNN